MVAFLYVLFYVDKNKVLFLSFFPISCLILGVILWVPVRKLRENGSLYYGGNTGFYSDTLKSLANYTSYHQQDTQVTTMVLNFLLLLFGGLVIFSIVRNRTFKAPQNIILLVLAFSVISVISQFYLLGNLFLVDRTALFFYPLLILPFMLILNNLRMRWTTILSLLVLVIFAVNFFLHANFYKTITWFFEAHDKKIVQLISDRCKQQKKLATIAFSWPFHKSLAYYLDQGEYDSIKFAEPPDVLKGKADYFIFLASPIDKVPYEPSIDNIRDFIQDTILTFPEEKVYLFKLRSR